MRHITSVCAVFCWHIYSFAGLIRRTPPPTFSWLVGCFRFSGPLREYFSLYRTVSQTKGKRGDKGQRRVKMSKQPPSALTASAIVACPTIIQIVGCPRHWKFTHDHRTTPSRRSVTLPLWYHFFTLVANILAPRL